MLLDFDDLCTNPDTHCLSVAAFLGIELSEARLALFRSALRVPESSGRFRKTDLAQFDPNDLAYLAELGHQIS
jgi:hypothetical protein